MHGTSRMKSKKTFDSLLNISIMLIYNQFIQINSSIYIAVLSGMITLYSSGIFRKALTANLMELRQLFNNLYGVKAKK
jgi:hypothetical protein